MNIRNYLKEKSLLEVPDTFVINNGNGRDDEVLFATKRYDRKIVAEAASPYRLHQEDFSQALGIPAAEKYEQYDSGYMRKMFEIVRRFSSNPIEDQLKLWDIIVVNFLIGNTDCHIKNYSLLYSEDLKTVRLAPAYDIVCTVIYQTTHKMSFYIGGEIDIDKIDREAFIKAAIDIGLGVKIAMNHFDRLVSIFEGAVNEVAMEMHAMGYDADDIRDAMINRKRTIKWN